MDPTTSWLINPDVGNSIRLHRPVDSWQTLSEATLPNANHSPATHYARDEAADATIVVADPAIATTKIGTP